MKRKCCQSAGVDLELRKQLRKHANWRKQAGRTLTALALVFALWSVIAQNGDSTSSRSSQPPETEIQTSTPNPWFEVVRKLDECRNLAFRNLDEQALANCVSVDSVQYQADLAAFTEVAADHLRLGNQQLLITEVREVGSRWSESGEFVVLEVTDCLQEDGVPCEGNREWLVTLEKKTEGWRLWETKRKAS